MSGTTVRGRVIMPIIIWGIGERGKRIYSRLSKEAVIAFIDSDSAKVGTVYDGKRIINLNEYIEKFSEYFILLSPWKTEEIKVKLQEYGITQYFELRESPQELQGKNGFSFLDKYIRHVDRSERIGIYGTEFYSIYLYNRLYQMNCRQIYLIPESSSDVEKINKLKKSFKKINLFSDDTEQLFVDKVYITTRAIRSKEDADFLNKHAKEIRDAFDLSNIINEYWNEELHKFHNLHIGERCFIVATGPSLRMEDLETLKRNNEKAIGMNRLYLAFKRSGWRPNYYVVEDGVCLAESGDIIKNLPVNHIFLSDNCPEMWEKHIPVNVYKYHSVQVIEENGRIPFSDDISKRIYAYATVTYSCIQLAIYMGFKEIVLLGVDFSFSGNYKDKKNHFDPNYYEEKSGASVFWEKESLAAYQTAREYADSHGIKIFNATRGGKLEVFERVDFDSLFTSKC